MYYADGTPKPSLTAVEDAARDARGGVIAKCAGLSLSPVGKVSYPRGQVADEGAAEGQAQLRHRLQVPRSARAPSARLDDALDARQALAGVAKSVTLPARRIARGDYRFTVTLTHPLNAGPPTELVSRP